MSIVTNVELDPHIGATSWLRICKSFDVKTKRWMFAISFYDGDPDSGGATVALGGKRRVHLAFRDVDECTITQEIIARLNLRLKGDVDEVVRTRESRASTRKRQNESDPSLLFPSAAASTTVATGASVAKRLRQSDVQATPHAAADATSIPVPDSTPEPEVLIMRGAEKPFMVYAPTCVNGSHQSFSVGRFVTLFAIKLTLIGFM